LGEAKIVKALILPINSIPMPSFSSLSSCMQCGTCVASCSVRYDLNLRKIISAFLGKGSRFWSEEIWNCTTCRICQDRCPRGIPLTELIIKARGDVVEEGKLPKEIRVMLESIQKFSNPFGVGRSVRNEWMKGLELKFAGKDSFDYLFFAGCAVVDGRIMEVARKAVELLKLAGVDFAVMKDEPCCGNDVKAVGEEGLFELLMEENKKLFEKYGVERVIVMSPHCYNAFKNYYGLEVKHISEILSEAVEEAKIRYSKVLELKVTYHDPCYLGRYNGIFDAPRDLIKSIPGIEFVEMQRSRNLSICCGGGGGNIVRDMRHRPSLWRIDEAELVAADVLAVSCPFCLMMLEDAAKVKKSEIEVMDIVELVYESVFGSKGDE